MTRNNCDVEVVPTDAGQWIIKDAAARVEILAEHVEVKENCKRFALPPDVLLRRARCKRTNRVTT